MPRPEVSVVMPFAGDADAANRALAALGSMRIEPGDELILADNSGAVSTGAAETTAQAQAVNVIRVAGERSPAHARNVGADNATREWILFIDADCEPAGDLLDAYFENEVQPDVGALAGEVVSAPGNLSAAQRYASARGFLGQQLHLEHPFMPRAVAANLMVRRGAFSQLGGFYEGLRAGEDTDFTWRLQLAGWRLEGRPAARVEHRYRASVGELRRQWRGYAAGRAWLGRRYDGFRPEPALGRLLSRIRGRSRSYSVPSGRTQKTSRQREPKSFLALDALLGLEELAGLLLSNQPRRAAAEGQVQVVFVADRFPAVDDPLSEYASTLSAARVEAASRPPAVNLETKSKLRIDYREDTGVLAGWLALARLAVRHPLRCARESVGRKPGQQPLRALAPAALRIARERGARIRPLGGQEALSAARRLARLTGRRLEA